RTENGRLRVRNRIYERLFDQTWVAQNMPNAEFRRQQAAYRKGLLRAAAEATIIFFLIAALSFAAISGRQHAVKKQQFAEQEREKDDQQRARAEEEAARADRNARELEKALAEAKQERQQALNQRAIAEQQRTLALRQQSLAVQQRDRAERQEKENRQLLYAAEMNLAGQAWEDAGTPRMMDLLNSQVPKPGQQDLRGFEWDYLWNLGNSELQSFRHGHTIASVSFFPDNKRLVTSSDDPVIRVWDIVTGQQVMALPGHSAVVWSVAASPDGQTLASASADRSVKIWNSLTGQELATLRGHTGEVAFLS